MRKRIQLPLGLSVATIGFAALLCWSGEAAPASRPGEGLPASGPAEAVTFRGIEDFILRLDRCTVNEREISVDATLKNVSGRALSTYMLSIIPRCLDRLRIWKTEERIVYRVKEVAPFHPYVNLNDRTQLGDGEEWSFTATAELCEVVTTLPESPPPLPSLPPAIWVPYKLYRLQTDSLEWPPRGVHVGKLPPGLYGVSSSVSVYVATDSPEMSLRHIEVPSKNMLWVNVRE